MTVDFPESLEQVDWPGVVHQMLTRPRSLNRAEMEARRQQAVIDMTTAPVLTQAAVARKYGVSRTTASKWSRTLSSGGSLASTKASGRPRRITAAQEGAIKALWYTRGRWSLRLFAEQAKAELGICYDPDHWGRVVIRMGLREKRTRRKT